MLLAMRRAGATDLVVRRVRVCVAQEHSVSVLLYLPALET